MPKESELKELKIFVGKSITSECQKHLFIFIFEACGCHNYVVMITETSWWNGGHILR